MLCSTCNGSVHSRRSNTSTPLPRSSAPLCLRRAAIGGSVSAPLCLRVGDVSRKRFRHTPTHCSRATFL
jgi:hypothetical protein